MASTTTDAAIRIRGVGKTSTAKVGSPCTRYLIVKSFMASFSSDLFSFDLAIRPLTYIWCSVSMLVVALLSQWPALRAVGRVDLPSVLRERAG